MKKEEEIAEFVGIMLGDGCIGIYHCNAGKKIKIQHQLKVTLDSRNKQYIKHVTNIINKVLDIDPVIYKRKNENTTDVRTFRKEKVLYVLNELGLKKSPKWNNMKIPKKYLSNDLSKKVLKGLFDTDGSVTISKNNGILYPRLELKISPSPVQNQVIKILKSNKFNYKIQTLDKGKIRIRISGKKELAKWKETIGTSNKLYLNKMNLFLEKGL